MKKIDLKDKMGLSSLLELKEELEEEKRKYILAEYNYERVSKLIASLPIVRYRLPAGDRLSSIDRVNDDTYTRTLSNIFEIEVKVVPTRYFTHKDGTYEAVEIPPNKVASFIRGLKNDMKNKNRQYSITLEKFNNEVKNKSNLEEKEQLLLQKRRELNAAKCQVQKLEEELKQISNSNIEEIVTNIR